MKFETKEAAVFFIDILGMSALTEGKIDLNGINEKFDTSIYEVEINGSKALSSPNQIIAAWTLKRFREVLRNVHFKYDVKISQLSDCAFVWSESSRELLLASSRLMWELTISGVLCRGGLSYGEVIIPTNDKESFGSFILGDAVTRAAKHEARGKGCRVFSDADAIHHFHKDFPGKVDSPVVSTRIYNDIFSPITNPLDFSIVDEFKWYLFHDLQGITTDKTEIEHNKLAMYMAALVSTIRHSPYYAWNSLNKHGLVQLAGSIEAISKSIAIHTGHDEAKLSAEYSMVGLEKVNRSHEVVKRHFYQYNVNALTKGTLEDIKERLEREVVKVLEFN
ncbi:hypothetical protein KZO25_13760 [Halomonas sp. ANAO-440]|uniref:hypothetical protein n=1 Tax=Halomonas sp. ANAO-440 TaxID=2861360 RepID=UPI001CAA6A0C|nr:hypothetical protein [Halomonas sp. ANAO-440]MBZ0331380.1 hypothetical protein [Halomonas sp. ANAO-440]